MGANQCQGAGMFSVFLRQKRKYYSLFSGSLWLPDFLDKFFQAL
jgi:hypothetical protein